MVFNIKVATKKIEKGYLKMLRKVLIFFVEEIVDF